jgi:serine/threonine protein phosphatase PrpC
MFVTFSASIQGESHKKNRNKACEDSSGAFGWEVFHKGKKNNVALAVVADGHGGDKYLRSRFGSELAVETAREEIEKFIAEIAERDKGFFDPEAQTDTDKKNGHKKNLATLEAKIIRAWKQKVDEHIQTTPLSPEETAFCEEKGIDDKNGPSANMYGTTLIAVLVTDFFWFALHIGDGGCVVIREDGGAEWAVKDDADQGFGTTHSLCNSDAAEHFRHNFGFETLLGATAASDGVTDSYAPEKYLEFTVTNLLKNFVEAPEQSAKALETEFLPMLSQKGSQDDVSLACVFNADAARTVLASIVEKGKNEYKLKELEKDAARKQVELDRLKGELDTLQKEAGTWKTRCAQEKDKLTQTDTRLKATQNDLKTTQSALDMARQEITARDSRISSLEEQLNVERSERVKAKNDLEKVERDRDKAERDRDKAVKQHNEFVKQHNEFVKRYNELVKRYKKLQKRYNELQKRVENEGYEVVDDIFGRLILQPLSKKAPPAAVPVAPSPPSSAPVPSASSPGPAAKTIPQTAKSNAPPSKDTTQKCPETIYKPSEKLENTDPIRYGSYSSHPAVSSNMAGEESPDKNYPKGNKEI